VGACVGLKVGDLEGKGAVGFVVGAFSVGAWDGATKGDFVGLCDPTKLGELVGNWPSAYVQ